MYARLLQASPAFGVFLLAVLMWWRMFLWTPPDQRKLDSNEAWFILMFIGPGLCVALGAFFQTMYRLIWPALLVLLAGAAAAYMGLVALFLFGYTGRRSLVPIGYLYLLLVLIAVLTSLVDAIIKLSHRSSRTVSNSTEGDKSRKKKFQRVTKSHC
jgi:hypothetical protein